MDVTNAEQAKSALLGYVEAEIAPEEPVLIERNITLPEEVDQGENGSIISQINKRIRLQRSVVRHIRFYHVMLYLGNGVSPKWTKCHSWICSLRLLCCSSRGCAVFEVSFNNFSMIWPFYSSLAKLNWKLIEEIKTFSNSTVNCLRYSLNFIVWPFIDPTNSLVPCFVFFDNIICADTGKCMRKRLANVRSRQLYFELLEGQLGNYIYMWVSVCKCFNNILQIPHTPSYLH